MSTGILNSCQVVVGSAGAKVEHRSTWVREHARPGRLPANPVSEIATTINQTTAGVRREARALVTSDAEVFRDTHEDSTPAPLLPANVTRECHLARRGFDLRCFARNLARRSSIGGEKSSLDDSATIPRKTMELNWRREWDSNPR